MSMHETGMSDTTGQACECWHVRHTYCKRADTFRTPEFSRPVIYGVCPTLTLLWRRSAERPSVASDRESGGTDPRAEIGAHAGTQRLARGRYGRPAGA